MRTVREHARQLRLHGLLLRASQTCVSLGTCFARSHELQVLMSVASDSVLELVASNAERAATAPGRELRRRHGLDTVVEHDQLPAVLLRTAAIQPQSVRT